MILRRALRTPFRLRTASSPLRRNYIAAPKDGEILLSRRSDRALPSIAPSHKFLYSLPLFLTLIAGSTLAIFNYQKSSSSVVTSSLYSLRVNPLARDLLGDEIYFRDRIPWIWGTIDQLHGFIDVRFAVKGKSGSGEMRFKSERKERMGFFETTDWTLTMKDGTVVDLMREDLDPLTKAADFNSRS